MLSTVTRNSAAAVVGTLMFALLMQLAHPKVAAGVDDTLLTAFQRMRIADVSQLPVLADDVVVGILDESDLLLHVYKQPDRFRDKVATAMTQRLETLDPGASLADLLAILNRDLVAIIIEDGRFFGLITRYDLLTFLRRSLP